MLPMQEVAFTRAQSRAVDELAIRAYGICGLVLMENAGRGVVDALLKIDSSLLQSDEADRRVTILCGKGNNAGDGFVIARHLEIRGALPQVVLLAPAGELQGDAQTNFSILQQTDVSIVDLSSCVDVTHALGNAASDSTWIVDAMLGPGAKGPPREPYRTAIEWMNSQPKLRMAVDVPSGLDCDTGQPAMPTVRADHTCTFVAPKIGFATAAAKEFVGHLHVVSIGIPRRAIADVVRDSPR